MTRGTFRLIFENWISYNDVHPPPSVSVLPPSVRPEGGDIVMGVNRPRVITVSGQSQFSTLHLVYLPWFCLVKTST